MTQPIAPRALPPIDHPHRPRQSVSSSPVPSPAPVLALFMASLLSLLFGGCAARPNLAPFAEATVQLHQAMTAAGRHMRSADVMPGSTTITDDTLPADLIQAQQQWQMQWDQRIAALDIWVVYADMIAALAAAPHPAHERTQQLAAALDELATLAHLAPMPAPDAASRNGRLGLAALIAHMISEAQNARTLRAAISAADPILQQLGLLLQDDLEDLHILHRVIFAEYRASLDQQFASHRAHYQEMQQLRAAAQQQHDALHAQLDDASLREPEHSALRAEVQHVRAALDDIARHMQAIAPQQRRYEQQSTSIERAQRRFAALIDAMQQTMTAWMHAHADIADALQSGRPVGMRLLILRTRQLRDALNAI